MGLISVIWISAALACARALAAGTSGWVSALLTTLLFLPLAIPVLSAVSFAPALLSFNDMPTLAALRASATACAANWLPLSIFALLFLMLSLIALFSAGLGLLLLIPITSGSLFAAYRDIFPGT